MQTNTHCNNGSKPEEISRNVKITEGLHSQSIPNHTKTVLGFAGFTMSNLMLTTLNRKRATDNATRVSSTPTRAVNCWIRQSKTAEPLAIADPGASSTSV
jgi:hypothetical protein